MSLANIVKVLMQLIFIFMLRCICQLECNWLVKSYETSEFDLNRLDHSGWNFWTGSIQREKTVHVLDNYCSVDTDCNNQGECIEESCHCENGVSSNNFFSLPIMLTNEFLFATSTVYRSAVSASSCLQVFKR